MQGGLGGCHGEASGGRQAEEKEERGPESWSLSYCHNPQVCYLSANIQTQILPDTDETTRLEGQVMPPL